MQPTVGYLYNLLVIFFWLVFLYARQCEIKFVTVISIFCSVFLHARLCVQVLQAFVYAWVFILFFWYHLQFKVARRKNEIILYNLSMPLTVWLILRLSDASAWLLDALQYCAEASVLILSFAVHSELCRHFVSKPKQVVVPCGSIIAIICSSSHLLYVFFFYLLLLQRIFSICFSWRSNQFLSHRNVCHFNRTGFFHHPFRTYGLFWK